MKLNVCMIYLLLRPYISQSDQRCHALDIVLLFKRTLIH
jgi:hypothetical protein